MTSVALRICVVAALASAASVACVRSSGFDVPAHSTLEIDGKSHDVDRIDIYVTDEAGHALAPERRMVIHAQAGEDGPALVLLLDDVEPGAHDIVPFGAPDITLLDGGESFLSFEGTVDVRESGFSADSVVHVVVEGAVVDACGATRRAVVADISGTPQVGVSDAIVDGLPPTTGFMRGTITYQGEERAFVGPCNALLNSLADDVFGRPAWTLRGADLCDDPAHRLGFTLDVAMDATVGNPIPLSNNVVELFVLDFDPASGDVLHVLRADLDTKLTLDASLDDVLGQVATMRLAPGHLVEVRENNLGQLVPNGETLTFDALDVRAPLVDE